MIYNHSPGVWDGRFLKLAEEVASWSKDPSTKTGAVIVDGIRLISIGYNGLPQAIYDSKQYLEDREMKYKTIIHCEVNAVLLANRSVAGCTLYTAPFMSCSNCASFMIQAGIKRVVSWYSDAPRWVESFKLASNLFHEAEVELDLYRKDAELL